jgi:mono/diheme cytochrome c family protein
LEVPGTRCRITRPIQAAIAAGALGLALASALGCERSEAPPAREPAAAPAPAAAEAARPDEGAVEEARSIFATRCVTCHGQAGAGDGPGSAALDPKPRDFRDPAWQSSVTDEQIQQAILYGGAAIGKSPAMPGNPDLMAKPAVTAALVAHLRGLEQP